MLSFAFVKTGRMTSGGSGLVILLLLSLSTFLDGYHVGWRFYLAGFFLGMSAILAAYVEEFMWILFIIALASIILSIYVEKLLTAKRHLHNGCRRNCPPRGCRAESSAMARTRRAFGGTANDRNVPPRGVATARASVRPSRHRRPGSAQQTPDRAPGGCAWSSGHRATPPAPGSSFQSKPRRPVRTPRRSRPRQTNSRWSGPRSIGHPDGKANNHFAWPPEHAIGGLAE